jgi:hypothetical protein
LPWSMCAMIQKFRMNFGSMNVCYSAGASNTRGLRRTLA